MSKGYYAALAGSFDKYGDRSAIFMDDGRSISYRGLADDAGCMAACLAATGARPGDRVASQVERSPEALTLFLACLRADLVYVPINPALTPAEVAYYLADAEPHVLVIDPPRERVHAAPHVLTLDAAGGGSLMEAARSQPSDLPAHAGGADDVALLLYTSGTTGKPKGAMLTHGNLASNVRTLSEQWGFTRDDVLLHALPLSHVHGLVVALGCAWLSGCTTRLLARFDPAQLTRELATATVFMGVPTHYTRLLAEPALGRDACRSMRLFVSGSAPLTAGTFAEFEQRTGHRILERYGMTETLMIASNQYDGERVAGSVGFPLPDVEVRVVGADGRPVATDTAGALEVRGPNVCRGYWRAPQKTEVAFRDEGWFITGDVGRIDGEGRVWLEGRASDLIISGGYNVYPREIEDALLALDGVTDAAVFGVPHPQWGESVVAALCARTPAIDEARMIAALRQRLAGYKLPKKIVLLDALPRNAMGKVQKEQLRARYATLFAPMDAA